MQADSFPAELPGKPMGKVDSRQMGVGVGSSRAQRRAKGGEGWTLLGTGAPLGPPGAGWAVYIPSVRELVGG